MNAKLLLLSATLLGGVASASAATIDVESVASRGLKFEVPAVAQTVSPAGLANRFKGANVTLALTIDAEGRPHNIRVISHHDRNLESNLVPAIAQWQFTPAKKDGIPVSTNVVLPITLVES